MGCASSTVEDKEGKARNDQIDASIREARQLARKEIKMLLLGAGESGKSTILKQMKLQYSGAYDEVERESYKEIIFSNTVQSMRAILDAMSMMDLSLEPRNEQYATFIQSLPAQLEGEKPPPQMFSALTALWADTGVQAAFVRRREFQLNDSASYYFDAINREENPMSSPTWIPDSQDVLRSRVKTTGITETTFKVHDLTYKLFDVGGQRSERKKWIHCFENVTAIVFLVAMSEYDQMLYEDENVNRMNEAIELFNSIVNSRWFVKTSVILFMNKSDLFQEKLKVSPLSDYFPDYTGDNLDYLQARSYLWERFDSLNQSRDTKQIYTWYTCATDTNHIRFVLNAVNDTIIQANLRECGLI